MERFLTFTAAGDCGRCIKCRGKLLAGMKMVKDWDGVMVSFSHFECPKDLNKDFEKRVIQGSK